MRIPAENGLSETVVRTAAKTFALVPGRQKKTTGRRRSNAIRLFFFLRNPSRRNESRAFVYICFIRISRIRINVE